MANEDIQKEMINMSEDCEICRDRKATICKHSISLCNLCARCDDELLEKVAKALARKYANQIIQKNK